MENVTKVYKDVTAIEDLTLEVSSGEFVVLVGPSGCGKSSLLQIVAGLEPVTSGRILLNGQDVTDVVPQERDIAMVFQNYALYPTMTVYGNLAFPLKMRGHSRDAINTKVQEMAKVLGLGGLLARRPGALSGGQRQRVAMGRALIREPYAFLMDEPLSNLDAALRVQMRTEIARLRDTLHITTIYVTHDQMEAMTLGERVAVMKDGRLQQIGDPSELYEHPENQFVAGFLGTPAMNFSALTPSEDGLSFGHPNLDAHLVRRAIGVAPQPGDVLGIRPTSFVREELCHSDDWPRVPVVVEVVEAMGSDTFLHFWVNDSKRESPIKRDDESLWVARVDSGCNATSGSRVQLAMNPSDFHLFEAGTGRRLGRGRAR